MSAGMDGGQASLPVCIDDFVLILYIIHRRFIV
jgi:hypothetical protein